MNFSVNNLFGKFEHIRIKLRIYSHLFNKSQTKNFIFCVVNVIGFTLSLASFSLNLIASFSYTLHQSTLIFKVHQDAHSPINFYFIINRLLEHRTFFKLPLVEEALRNLLINCLPKQFLHTIKRGILLQRETFCQ